MNNQYPEQSRTSSQPQQSGDNYGQTPPLSQPSPNPSPSPQPGAIPPQPQAGNQNSTGLESQPVLSENYVPAPSDQAAQIPQKPPFLKLFFIVIVILIILGLGIFFLFFFGKGTLNLTVTPAEARVSIDEKDYPTKLNYKIRLADGEHILKIRLDGYVECNKKITIENFKATDLTVELKPTPTATKLLDKKLEYISLSPDNNYIVGLGNSGKTFYRLPINGQTNKDNSAEPQEASSISSAQAITEDNFANIVGVSWNPSKPLAVLKIKNEEAALKNTDFYKPDSGNGTITTWIYDFNRYDLANQKSYYLGDDIGDVVWSADGNNTIYFSKSKKSLYKASSSGANPKLLKNISGFVDPYLSLSSEGKFLAIISRSTNYDKNYLNVFDTYSNEMKQITKKGNQKKAIFNPSEKKVLYSTYSEDPTSNIYTTLSVSGADGSDNQDLNLRALLEKVKFIDDNNFLYVKLDNQTQSESLQKYNIDTKEERQFFFKTDETLRFENIVLNDNKNIIYFLSENYLYSFELITDEY